MRELSPQPRALWLLALGGLLFVAGFVWLPLALLGVGVDLLVLGLALADALRARKTPLELRRDLPDPTHQGEAQELRLELIYRGDRPLLLSLRDALHPSLRPAPLEQELRLEPQSAAELPEPIRPLRRGAIPLAPLSLRLVGPMGLGAAHRAVDLQQQLRVFPRAHLDAETSLLVRQALRPQAGAHRSGQLGQSTDLYALREYQSGDSLRQIHWRSSARLGRPVTRETSHEQHQQLVVLLDAGRPMASLADELGKLDHAISSSLLLLRFAAQMKDTATLVLFSRELRQIVRVDSRTTAFGPIWRQLHEEQADLEEPDYGAAVAWCEAHLPRRSMVLLISSLTDALGAEELQAALLHLSRRHIPALINLEDPGLIAIARGAPEDLHGALAKTSALVLQERLSRLGRGLRSSRVAMVSAPASQLSFALVRRYLEAKGGLG